MHDVTAAHSVAGVPAPVLLDVVLVVALFARAQRHATVPLTNLR
jgi:hypothetical protein